jgi:hypothetical protein
MPSGRQSSPVDHNGHMRRGRERPDGRTVPDVANWWRLAQAARRT